MITYLALGDSYTIGEGVPLRENFPSLTTALLRQKKVTLADPVIIAITGWTTDELSAAIRERALQETFSFATLLIGVNNQYRGRSVENYRDEFTQLLNQAIAFAKNEPTNVIVLSIPDWSVTPFAEGRNRQQIADEIDGYNKACKEISEAKGCPFLDITDSTRAHGQMREYLAEDGLHPSGKEYAVWAERLANEIMQISTFA